MAEAEQRWADGQQELARSTVLIGIAALDELLGSTIALLRESGYDLAHAAIHARVPALVAGKVWITETGGIIRSKHRRYGVKAAARATKTAVRIATVSRRVKRVHFYHWIRNPRNYRDSAFIGANGAPRPAYRIFKHALKRARGSAVRVRCRGRCAQRRSCSEPTGRGS